MEQLKIFRRSKQFRPVMEQHEVKITSEMVDNDDEVVGSINQNHNLRVRLLLLTLNVWWLVLGSWHHSFHLPLVHQTSTNSEISILRFPEIAWGSRMARCARCWLHKTMRIMNIVLNLYGIGMIIYSLWLQREWDEGIAELHIEAIVPKPWFLYTCLSVGIGVCFLTLVGYMVGNCISNSVLCIYIVSICCILLLQIWVIDAIFFKIDWGSEIDKFIDATHNRIKSFLIFHIAMCRWLTIVVTVAQFIVAILAGILWAAGTDRWRQTRRRFHPPDFANSFMDESSLPLQVEDSAAETCDKCLGLDAAIRHHEHRRRSFLSYVKSILRL